MSLTCSFRSIPDHVEAVAAAQPGAIAIDEAGGRVLRYGELVAHARGVAAWLASRGAGPEVTVGVCVPRGAALVVAELGVWFAGAAFVPLDPDAPAERLRSIARDAGLRWVLTDALTIDRLPGGPELTCVRVDQIAPAPAGHPRPAAPGPRQMAYVMYTSGSTGTPKGVVVEHGSLASFVAWHRGAFELTPRSRTTMVYSPAFDSSIAELWPALTAGARIAVPDHDTRLIAERLQAWLVAEQITLTDLPSPLVERLLDLPWPADAALRTVLSGGDRLHGRPPPGCRWQLWNQYGPTEATVTATSGRVEPTGQGAPDIGRPIAGVTAYVLDDALQPVPAGVEAELYLGGAGVARGYLGQPEATAARFLHDPFAAEPGARMYRTGDRVRRTTDGCLVFCGRADDQIKLRGFRIEPAEIVAALRAHPGIAGAHVALHADALVAHIVPADPHSIPANAALRAHLQARLPEPMIPAAFVIIDRLPLTASGKVDARALPSPAQRAGRTGAPPSTAVEHTLAAIWQAVLRVAEVGLDDDFFALGGHSLLAAQIKAQIEDQLGAQLSLRELFAHRELRRLAALVEQRRREPGAGATAAPPITREVRARERVSVQQEQVWFFEKLAPDNLSYRAQTTIRSAGPLDVAILERALTEITRRHEILRTTYEERDGEPWQVVRPVEPVRVPIVDLAALAPDARRAARDELVHRELRRPLTMFELPLMRWLAIRIADDDHELVVVEHHVVHDGESFAVLMQELEVIYNAFAAGAASPLPELPVQYADFARWQRAALGEPAMQAHLAFWRDRLAGAPPVLALPADRPRPPVQSFRGDIVRFELPPALPGAIRALSEAQGVTPFAILMAAFASLLHRYTHEVDLCVGTAVANRGVRQTERLIGMFVNTIVLRCDVSDDPAFATLVGRVAEVTAEASAHEAYPFPKLVEQLHVARDPSRNPIVQVMFSFHDSVVPEPQLGGAACTVYEQGNGSSKVDLDVVAIPHAQRHLGDAARADDRITFLWEYNLDLFDRSTMERMAAHFVRLAEAAVAAPATPISRLPVLSDGERRDAIAPASTAAAYASVVEQVAAVAAAQPEAIAIDEGGGQVMRYGELIAHARGVAAWLAERGAGPEVTVGVCVPRGAALVVAELGVWLAGAAFVPLDPDAPAERLRAIARDAGLRWVLTDALTIDRLPGGPELACVRVDQIAPAPAGHPCPAAPGPRQMAYVMYTSGSTGTPKGVVVEHGSLASFVAWHRGAFELTPRSRTTMVYSPAFDSSIAELWPALTAGARIAVPDHDTRLIAERLQAWLVAEQITLTDLPSPLVERLLDLSWPADAALRTVLSGGDRLHGRPPPGCRWQLWNQYGPTEATVTATSGRVEPTGQGAPDIGRPIAGVTAYVLDDALQPVPAGVEAELYLGGAGVARGYLGQPEATAARFLRDPFAAEPGARMYRTGDRVRRTADGRLVFCGRADDQIKLRGFRIEPAEIVAALRAHPGIADAHVALHAGELVAYLVSPGVPPDAEALRAHVARRLPGYMVPSAYVALRALPVTANGKLDAAALPPPERPPVAPRQRPTSELERALAGVWQRVLRLDQVGIDDSFFDLGGNSLLLAQVHHAITAESRRALTMVALFEHPTIRQLARYLAAPEDAPAAVADEGAVTERTGARARLQGRRARLGTGKASE